MLPSMLKTQGAKQVKKSNYALKATSKVHREGENVSGAVLYKQASSMPKTLCMCTFSSELLVHTAPACRLAESTCCAWTQSTIYICR